MYELEMGCGSNDMMGSANACRSYGLTHGSMLPQPVSASTAHAASNADAREVGAIAPSLTLPRKRGREC